MPPKPGKRVNHIIETSGNRHQRGAMRVAVKIDLGLTFEPDEARLLAAKLEEDEEIPEHLQETYELLILLVATTPRKKANLANSLKAVAGWADLANES